MKLIAVDAGHGMDTAGKRTPTFPDGTIMKENEFNRATAKFLVEALERNGFKTLLTAPEITDTPLQTRVKRANKAKADAFICIHANAYDNKWNDANGIESWIYNKSGNKTMKLAEDIQKELIAITKRKDRGIKKSSDLYVLRYTNMIAVLVECGFLTNLEEATLLRSENYRKKCAEAICKGICKYYNVSYQSESVQDNINCCPKRYQKVSELPYGKEVVQMLIDKELLKGNEKGDLDLTIDMVRLLIILYRAKVFEKIE
ncbi:MAG: N-acetylmuramoyl-L-alanine amidase [Firmicutes bacterium]|jgi:N-acetylmuramoyl-L-alanine amidase|nr:N-acetylmuramoyl-L-alanine amidase [Bacillota bacterium]